MLIEKGADLNARDESGNTALIHAVESRHGPIARLLAEKGAVVKLKNNIGHFRHPP